MSEQNKIEQIKAYVELCEEEGYEFQHLDNLKFLLQEIERKDEALKQAQDERFEYEKLAAENQSEISRLSRELEWYGNEVNWSQGDYEGGVFFSYAERDAGQRAREAL